MEVLNILTCTVCLVIIIQVNTSPLPGHHHVHHRIIVPQKIKTIYHTKIVKVPEHHHYFHEKEKIIQLEAPHHKQDVGIDLVSHKAKLSDFHQDDSFEDFSEYSSGGDHHFSGERHNIFKKHAVTPKTHKRSRTQRKRKHHDDE